MTVQQYCLRWNNHQPNFISVFSSLLSSQSLVDVTLAAEGKHLQAHKVVLSACSSYFQSLFTVNPCKHPIVILKDVKFADLKVMVDFMYHGEVNVSQEQLPYILKTAEMLKIKGLTEIPVDQSITSRCQSRITDKQNLSFQPEDTWNVDDNRPTSPSSPTNKRKRLKKNVICSTGTAIDAAEGSSGDILLSSMDNVFGTVMKSENERYISTESTNTTPTTVQKCNGAPVPSIQTGAAHDVMESEPSPHHISLQVAAHEINTSHSLDCSAIDMPRTTTTTAPQMTTVANTQQSQSSSPGQEVQQQQHMGPKRGRFLMRQPRIKRESDSSQDPECDLGSSSVSSQYLTVPPIRIERQCSEPIPSVSPSPDNLLYISDHVLVKQHSHPLLPSKTTESSNPRSSHCPVVRSGPALGCNYCWNTVDTHGRVLRRKTKYHCPECQTNLCIVPCFQEYHKCQGGGATSATTSSTSNAVQPSSSLLLTPSVKMFPKTT